ncbi:unnamed protein product [Cylindrotheca closterium]|uniref:Uncharacterized protein n=1 Tax=Cylindrotheca closterium TaxID=2856 RepID=A0AAD2G986_9STRA|nr:unnamed protein product [Cylindrotheca closterium]
MQDDSDRNVYHFRGAKDETVPSMVQTVVVDQSVTELPDAFGNRLHRRVKELILKGVKVIGKDAFRKCGLQQITIYTANTQAISTRAFEMATCLENVDFVSPSPSNNEHASLSSSEGKDLTVIEEEAFVDCSSLQRIKIPSTVKMMGKHVFADCSSLVEANLSKPCMKMIAPCTFESCRSLQAISLPGTLECIGHLAFRDCCSLVTVEIPAAVESLVIQERAFSNCQRLMNLTLPANYSSDETSFEGCKLLEESFGKDEAEFLEDLDDETDTMLSFLHYYSGGISSCSPKPTPRSSA